jgi:hypothetical protein
MQRAAAHPACTDRRSLYSRALYAGVVCLNALAARCFRQETGHSWLQEPAQINGLHASSRFSVH